MMTYGIEYKCSKCNDENKQIIAVETIYAPKECNNKKYFKFKCKNCGEIHYINRDDTTEILTGIRMEKVGVIAY